MLFSKCQRQFGRIGLTLAVAAIACSSASGAPHFTLVAKQHEAQKALSDLADPSTYQLYIIALKDAALAEYNGELSGFARPERDSNNGNRLNPQGPSSRAYVSFLEGRQAEFLADLATSLGRSLAPQYAYRHAFNGMAVELTAAEAALIEARPDVRFVEGYRLYEQDTDAGPDWIGAPGLWSGANTPGLPGTRGEGVVVGVIDSGINSDHPSYAATDSQGFTHTNPLGSGVFLGYCATTPGFCNDKLIGAYDFVFDVVNGQPDVTEEPEPEDNNSHGSHTAGTAAGNELTANFDGVDPPVSGVAPRANIIAYDVCYTETSTGRGLCPNASTLAGIDQTVADGIVDVLNYSISGGAAPWDEANSLAFLNAFNAGIFPAVSAGNSGPGPNTLGHLEPWVSSSAASTHDRFFGDAEVDVTSGAPTMNLIDIPAVEGTGPALGGILSGEIRFETVNPEGCTAGGGFPAGFFTGSIALIQRGTCSFAEKIDNAVTAGAVGAVIFSNRAGAPFSMGGLTATTVPGVMLSQAFGESLRNFVLGAGGATTVDINPLPTFGARDASVGDIIAAFSSRGPSGALPLVKPDVANPGVNILAPFSNGAAPSAPEFGVISGTSMASPHTAGSAALMRALFPTWTVAEIKSAMMMTANPDMVADNDGVIDPAGVFDRGAGRVDLTRAALSGLVLDETGANFAAADPDMGGDPGTLNLASLGDATCSNNCLFTRQVRSVAAASTDYSALFVGDIGVSGTVTPTTFTLTTGQTQSLNIDINVSGVAPEAWYFGEVQLVTTTPEAGLLFRSGLEADDPATSTGTPGVPLRMPAAVFAQSRRIDVQPTMLTSTIDVDTTDDQTLTISNVGGGDLTWDSTLLATAPTPVFEQAGGPTNGIVSSFYNVAAAGVYSTDDFTVAANATVSTLFADGFVSGSSLAAEATAINWYVYTDVAGLPAGHPDDGMANEFWEFSTAPNAPGVNIAGDSITLDLATAGAPVLNLTPGTFWLMVAPSVITATLDPRWSWLASGTSNGTNAQLIDPSDLFAAGFTTYTDLTVVDPVFAGLTFSILGDATCGAPWVSINPTGATVGAGGATMATVTFDATGLTPGSTQNTVLCISSDDPTNPVETVPVTLNVNP